MLFFRCMVFIFSKSLKAPYKSESSENHIDFRSFRSIHNQAKQILFTNSFLVFHIYQSNTKVFTKSFYAFSASTILWKSIRLNASALLNSSSLRTSNT